MNLFDINAISSLYDVKEINTNQIEMVFDLFMTNTQYLNYCGVPVSRDIIAEDIVKCPKGFDKNNKHYLGYFEKGILIAVIDLLIGYPNDETVWIGFFMVNGNYSRKGIGTNIINEFTCYATSIGFKRVGLGFEITNPQSSYFWNKNGFITEKVVENQSGKIAVAYKIL